MVLHSPCSVIPITKVNWLQLWRNEIPRHQRHPARAMEDQQQRAADLGRRVRFYFTGDGQSGQAGMAALTGTLAGTRQGMIRFTQQNEQQEADRIGIQVLQRRDSIRRRCQPLEKIT